MSQVFENKSIVLGVTSSIACYKAVELASKLTQSKACVTVVMTPNATKLVTPLIFRSITHNPVVTDIFQSEAHYIEHIAVARNADLLIIAPATANTIAKIAYGFADNALTTVVLAVTAPIIIAPAMEEHMYTNAVTQENLAKLSSRGHIIVGPASGYLASGASGIGRMVEVEELLRAIYGALSKT